MIKSKEETYKQITFDIDTKKLENVYPTPNWRHAYEIIKNHMKRNGFSWLQGSVYVSNKPITSRKVALILEELVFKYPYFNRCMRDCRETVIMKFFDRNDIFSVEKEI